MVQGFGLLQDGGLRANNPIEAGLWELDSIWPGHARPGLVLSVGTGYQGSPAHELGGRRGFWFDSFMPRIIRVFLSSPCLHGQNSWIPLLNRVDKAGQVDFFRLNLEFDEQEPALDDVAQLPWLCELTMNTTLNLIPYRNAIWASAFLFELIERPLLSRGLCSAAACTLVRGSYIVASRTPDHCYRPSVVHISHPRSRWMPKYCLAWGAVTTVVPGVGSFNPVSCLKCAIWTSRSISALLSRRRRAVTSPASPTPCSGSWTSKPAMDS